MLIETLDIRQREELILDRDDLCVHVEAGNPFAIGQDYVFSSRVDRKIGQYNVCQTESVSEIAKDVSDMIKQGLQFSLDRANRIPNSPHTINAVALNYLRMGDIDNAISGFKKALALDENNFATLANLAKCYFLQGRSSEAFQIYQDLERRSPRDIRVLMNIALLFFQQRDLETSARYLKQILKIETDYAPALNNFALIYLAQRNPAKAISLLRKALDNKDDDPCIYNNLGVCFVLQRNFKKAIKNFTIALAINKGARDVIHNLSNAYQEISEHEKVISLLDNYLNSHPREVALRNVVAWSYLALGLIQKSLQELHIALKNSRVSEKDAVSGLLNNIGVAYSRIRAFDKAESYFRESLQASAKANLITFCNLIKLYFKSNDLRNAKVQLDDALEVYPDNPLLLSYLGDYYYHSNDYGQAKAIYEKVIGLDPNCLGPYAGLSVIETDVYDITTLPWQC